MEQPFVLTGMQQWKTSLTNVLGIFLNVHCNLLCVKEWSKEEYAFTEQYAPLPSEVTCVVTNHCNLTAYTVVINL